MCLQNRLQNRLYCLYRLQNGLQKRFYRFYRLQNGLQKRFYHLQVHVRAVCSRLRSHSELKTRICIFVIKGISRKIISAYGPNNIFVRLYDIFVDWVIK